MSQAMFDVDLRVGGWVGGAGGKGGRALGRAGGRVEAWLGWGGNPAVATAPSGVPGAQPLLLRAPPLQPLRNPATLQLCNPNSLPACLQGKDWNGQVKWGTSNFYGANYFQSVTPRWSVGGEVFYLAEQRRRWVGVRHGALGAKAGAGGLMLSDGSRADSRAVGSSTERLTGHLSPGLHRLPACPLPALPACSGLGLAARHVGEAHVATAQIANTGLISLTFIQKVSDKVRAGGRGRGGGRQGEGGALF